MHRFVPEVEPLTDEPREETENRKRDAGSTPRSERKTYEPVEEYRPPPVPEEVHEAVTVADIHEDTPVPATGEYEPPPEPEMIDETIDQIEETYVIVENPPAHVVEEYLPPREPQIVEEPLAGSETTTIHVVDEFIPPEVTVVDEPTNQRREAEPTKSSDILGYSPPPYDGGVQVVPDYVMLPPPRKHILVNQARVEEGNVILQEIEPLPDQKTYTQQLLPPRRFPPLSKPSEVTTTVPDVRMAAEWTQVEVEHLQRQNPPPLIEKNAASAYRPPPLPTTEEEPEDQLIRSRESSPLVTRKIPVESTVEIVQTVPAVIRRYQPPPPPVESSLKSEPIAYREPVIAVERKPEPVIYRDAPQEVRRRSEPLAHNVPRIDTVSKAEPIAHRETATHAEDFAHATPEAQGSYKPPPLPQDDTMYRAQNENLTTIHKTEPIAFKAREVPQRYVEPAREPHIVSKRDEQGVRSGTTATQDFPDGTSFSKQNITTDPSDHVRMDSSSGATVVEATRIARPIVFRRTVHPGDEVHATAFTPPNSLTGTGPAIHESIRRGQPLLYQEVPMREEPVPVASRIIYRKPAIPPEFAKSQFSSDDSYEAPLIPAVPVPAPLIVDDNRAYFPVEQRKAPPVVYQTLPSHTTGTAYDKPPLPFNGQIDDKDKARSPPFERQTPPVNYDQAYREQKGSPVIFTKPPAAYNQNNSNDGDDEADEDIGRRMTPEDPRHPVQDFEVQRRERIPIETSYVPQGRRTRSVLEVSQSTMEPVMRRRVNSLDPRLTRDLREYVERHKCDENCCKVVCPRRLAENIDNLHYADDVRILTNLDVLGRRRLSYLLAVEAQRYVSYLDSKFISAAGTEEGSKTSDSGCDPSSKVSEAESDATISDGEFVSEEAVARELAKIEKIRQRNAQFQENGVVPPPYGFGASERHQVYPSSERKKNRAERPRDSYRAPPIPSDDGERSQGAYRPPRRPSDSGSAGDGRSVHAQNIYRKPELPRETSAMNQDAYRVPELSSGYESPNGYPSNPAAREAMKNIIEGRTVFDRNTRTAASSQEQRDGDAKEAYNTWDMIWRNAKREETPALSGHEILSLFGVMRHILGTKSSLQEVRDNLRTIIRKNGMGLRH